MKELSIEEKAKRYDEALNRAKGFRTDECRDVAEYIFPELAESEDEKIKTEIIKYINSTTIVNFPGKCSNKQAQEWIDWLEKQGNLMGALQEANKKIGELVEENYYLKEQGEQKSAECKQETKPNGGIVWEDFTEGDGYYKVNLAYLSKSQVELIENLVASWQNHINNTPDWSKEDEAHVYSLSKRLEGLCRKEFAMTRFSIIEDGDWLKSLKERMQPQLNQEWSGGDEAHLHSLVTHLEQWIERHPNTTGADIQGENVAWLKSLRPQNRWKPSDEQMEVLLSEVKGWTKGCPKQIVLESLYQDLKKLKE